MKAWVGLSKLRPDVRIQTSFRKQENCIEIIGMHFECDFSLFRDQTLNLSSLCERDVDDDDADDVQKRPRARKKFHT